MYVLAFPPTAALRGAHENTLLVQVRHLYKDEFDASFARILAENGWDQARQEIMICCPRRFGKTWATAMYVAAYLYAIPSCELCIFSPSRRQSQKLLNLVRTFLAKLPGAMDRVEKSNAETMWMRGDATEDDRRIVSSYPSSVKTLKGVGGDVIICEEAAAMDTAVFYEPADGWAMGLAPSEAGQRTDMPMHFFYWKVP